MASVDEFLMHYHMRGISTVRWQHTVSLHVWKVAANSAIDAQIEVLMVYVHTYIYQSGLFGTHWYHHHPVLQGKHYLNTPIHAFILRVMSRILELAVPRV